MTDMILSWAIPILITIAVGLLVIILIRKFVFKKETAKFLIMTEIGIVLTALGLAFVANFNRILQFLGFKIPIDTDPITPTDLKTLIEQERERVRKEKEDELKAKTPDNIIDHDLPPDARDAVRTDIDNGKRRIDDLFHPKGVSGSTGPDKKDP